MNPFKWLSNIFRRPTKRKRKLKYRRSLDERLCTDSPGTPEWNRFWESWEETKSDRSYGTLLFRSKEGSAISRDGSLRNNRPTFIPVKSNSMKRKVHVYCERAKHKTIDTTKIRAQNYRIKSYGFPVTVINNCGLVTVKVHVGQPNGLLTTRINSSACEINMEVVGVQDHLIKKWLVIRTRTSAEVIGLTSPISDSDGDVVFSIP